MSSSGLVTPSPLSAMRFGKVTGRSKAPLPAFICPLPSMIDPAQFTVTFRENVAMTPPRRRTTCFELTRPGGRASLLPGTPGDGKLHDHAGDAECNPHQQDPVVAGRGARRIREPHVVPRGRV